MFPGSVVLAFTWELVTPPPGVAQGSRDHFLVPSTPHGHIGGAGRRAARGKQRGPGRPPELYRPVFPYLIRGGCGRRGSNGRIRRAAVSDGVHSRRSHDPASLVGNFPPNALPHRFARDSRRRSAPGLSSGVERPRGPPTRISHLGRRLEIWTPTRMEMLPVTAG